MLLLHGINKQLDGQPVLHDINLSVSAGSRVAITGPSGVGKTTLLRLIAGLERPDSGDIKWSDHNFYDAKHWLPPWQRSVGMVFQDLALWPHMTAQEHIMFILKQDKKLSNKQRIEQTIQILHDGHLPGLEKRYPAQLSGGQQQRLALVRALAARPELLLLDEAFTSIDMELEQSLWDNLTQYQSLHNTTIIFVTHDVNQIDNRADTIFQMSQGHLQQVDSQEPDE